MSETTWLDKSRSIAVAKKQRKQRSDKGSNRRSAEQIERICEMRKLRDNGATIQAIGNIYGISRERVRQLIGNTGYAAATVIKNERQNIVNINKDLTTPELAEKLGVSTRGFARNYHHPVAGDGPAARGNQAEVRAAEILRHNGFMPELMPLHHPFDMLINGSIRIDVKSTYKPLRSPSRKNTSPMWTFHVKQDTRHKCDFYFCMIAETEDIFIIPSKDVPDNMDNITFCFPTERPELSKWQNYQDAYDLIWAALEAAGVGDEN